ncbi:MAG: transposase [Promethearchaeota archaeon]
MRLQLISIKVNVLIDFTEHSYYGKRDDKMIKGTNRGKGTKKMRLYLGFSILSKGIHLFAGLEQIAKGQFRMPAILKFLENLIYLGFELNFVMIDREFYQAELLKEIKTLKGEVLIPSKSYKKINMMIEEYLKDTRQRIRRYTSSSAPGGGEQFSQDLYLLLRVKKGHSLLSVKQAFKKGTLTLDDVMKLIYAVMTTQKPRGDTSSWASRTARFYKKRWFVETGFTDLNRMGRRWKSKYDNKRYLDMQVRMLLYNSWKINKAWLKKCRKNGNLAISGGALASAQRGEYLERLTLVLDTIKEAIGDKMYEALPKIYNHSPLKISWICINGRSRVSMGLASTWKLWMTLILLPSVLEKQHIDHFHT